MKVVFAGGGSGGHFTPIIAIAEDLRRIVDEEHYVTPKLYFMSTDPYDIEALFANDIEFVKISAGKKRTHFSARNLFEYPKAFLGVLIATWKLFLIYPDLVVGKGGYASYPTLVAARILRIPVMIHESDAVPGRANLSVKDYASKIAIAYKAAAEYFDKEKTALVGIPLRKAVRKPVSTGAREYLGLEDDAPVIFVYTGSQGAERINNMILRSLNTLINHFQIVHQTGKANLESVKNEAEVVLQGHPHISRYRPFGYLSADAFSMIGGVANLVIMRAGSTSIFEIANWGIPSIIIPIPRSISRDQAENALAYSRTGAAILMEEGNMTDNLLISEVQRLYNHPEHMKSMHEAAKAFARPDAAEKMAREILHLVLKHEKK